MDLIDRYLDAVAAQLSAAERADIVAELRDLILSRFEAREESLGRALREDEQEAILHEIGHPLIVAGRYRKGPDALIGPELFPYWLFGIKAGLLILALLQALALGVAVLADPENVGRALGHAFNGFFSAGLTLMGALTLTGAVMEHYGLKPSWLTRWRVADLPAFGLADPVAWRAAFAGGTVREAAAAATGRIRVWGVKVDSRPGLDALASLIAGAVFVLWWIGALHVPGLSAFGLRGGEMTVTAAPIWTALYAPILAWALAGMAVDAVGLMRPQAERLRAFLKIPVAAAGLWLGWRLFEAGHWFTLAQGGATAPVEGGLPMLNFEALKAINDAGRGLTDTAMTLSTVMSWGLAVIMLSLVFSIFEQMWRISRMKGC